MTLYPEAQKKAQDELDRVCQGRFPDFGDRKSLPQLEALYLECLRWHPVAPLGMFYHSIIFLSFYRLWVIVQCVESMCRDSSFEQGR